MNLNPGWSQGAKKNIQRERGLELNYNDYAPRQMCNVPFPYRRMTFLTPITYLMIDPPRNKFL